MALVLTIGGVNRTSVLVEDSLSVEQQAADFISICSLTLVDAAGNIAIAAEDAITVVDGATTFFSGRVVDIRYSLFTTVSRFIEIKCQDLNAIVGETILDNEEVFAAEADADIIDSLFDDYLPAVDSETEVATIQDPLTITFITGTPLRNALSQICTRTGGYFYVDFSNVLHYFDAEADGVAWWLSDDPDQADSFSYFDVGVNKTSLATTRLDGVYVIGDGVEGWRGTHVPGDRQAVARDLRITTATGRDERGDAILARYGSTQVIYTVTTYKAGLRAGMDIRFICALYGVDDTFTVRKMTVRWDKANVAYYILTLGDVVNPSLVNERILIDTLPQALGPITAPRLPTSSRGWSHNIVFSATDHDTVAWAAAGVITLADGTTYTIDAGNTDNPGAMAATTYVYLDIDTSVTVLQVTTVSSTAVGSNKLLIAWAKNQAAGLEATFIVFGGAGLGPLVTTVNIADNAITTGKILANTIIADDIAAATITANEIAANTIVAGNIAAGAIETDELNALAVTAAKIAANTITADKISMGIGDGLFNAADGLLLLGPHCEINTTEWWSARKQKATLSGAFHQESGRWLGTKGLVVEKATTNLVLNPSGETNTTSWVSSWGDTVSRGTTYSRFDKYGLNVTAAGGDGTACGAVHASIVGLTAEDEYTASAWVFIPPASGVTSVHLTLYDPGWANGENSDAVTDVGVWKRVEVTKTLGVGVTSQLLVFWCGAQDDGAVLWFDGIQLEHSDHATSYCDGSLGTGYAWTGAAHGSTSTRAVTEVNLDAHVGLISSNDTMSFRFVVQMPYDADAVWPEAVNCYLMGVQGADVNNRILLIYNRAEDKFFVYIGNVWRLGSAVQTFDAGDLLDLIITIDFAGNSYALYIDGEESDTDTTALGAPTLTAWQIGASHLGAQQTGFVFSEFAVFDRVVTAIEVAGLYTMTRPMIDMGSLDKPGIYILDGKFQLASSTSGARTEILPESIAIGNAPPTYDSGVGVWLGVDTDAVTKFFVGDDGGNKLLWDGSTLTIAGEGSGVTNIDGGNIQANSITAAEIAANAIETDELNALAVTAAKIAANTITADKISMGIGDGLFNLADGLLLLGPHCEISPTEWRSARKQLATLSGAFHQESGRWLGTRGLVVEEATTNLILNPSIEVSTAGWSDDASTLSRDTTYWRFGVASMKVVTDDAGAGEGFHEGVTAETAADTEYTFSVWMRGSGTMRLYFSDDVSGVQAGDVITLTNVWTRYQLTKTYGIGSVVRSVHVLTNVQQDITWYCDGFQLEEQDYATSYADGSLGTGYAWTGAAHGSTSTRTANQVNLDAHVGLIASNPTLSFRTVVQMPYDADTTWPLAGQNTIWDTIKDADGNNYILLYYVATDDKIKVYINGAIRLLSAAQTWEAGAWLDILVTLDFAADSYNLYINGILEDTDTTGLAAPAVNQWNLGTDYLGRFAGGFNIAEYAAFDRVLTAIEAAGMYALTRPMIDMGSMDKPGIYILDGAFKIASSTSGNRIEIDADEIVGYDSGGTKQFYLQASDGKAYAGAGAVVLDENGMHTVGAGVAGTTRKIRFYDNSTAVDLLMGNIYGDWAGAGSAATWLMAWRQAGDPWTGSQINIAAVDTVAGTDVRITVKSSGIISMGAGAGHQIGLGTLTPGARVTVDQPNAAGNIAALGINQSDESEEFIEFIGAIGVAKPIDATTALGAYYGMARVSVAGVGMKWIALYN